MHKLIPPILRREMQLKQYVLLYVTGLHTLYESFMVLIGMQDTLRGRYPDGYIQDFFIYHYGNFNHAVVFSFLLDAVLSYFIRNNLVRMFLVGVPMSLLFILIEQADRPDILAGLVGIALYILLSPKRVD